MRISQGVYCGYHQREEGYFFIEYEIFNLVSPGLEPILFLGLKVVVKASVPLRYCTHFEVISCNVIEPFLTKRI